MTQQVTDRRHEKILQKASQLEDDWDIRVRPRKEILKARKNGGVRAQGVRLEGFFDSPLPTSVTGYIEMDIRGEEPTFKARFDVSTDGTKNFDDKEIRARYHKDKETWSDPRITDKY